MRHSKATVPVTSDRESAYLALRVEVVLAECVPLALDASRRYDVPVVSYIGAITQLPTNSGIGARASTGIGADVAHLDEPQQSAARDS